MGVLKIIFLAFLYFIFSDILPLLTSCFFNEKIIQFNDIFLFNIALYMLLPALIGFYIVQDLTLNILVKIISFYIFLSFSLASLAVLLKLDCYYHDIPYSILDFLPIMLMKTALYSLFLLIIYFITKKLSLTF